MNKTWVCHTILDLKKLAVFFSTLLKPGDIVALEGFLGSGKTEFARSVIHSLCGSDILVSSPTFNLMQVYKASGFSIYHFDLYRLDKFYQIEELGMNDIFFNSVSLIEWPDRLGLALPRCSYLLKIKISSDCKSRFITILK